MDLIKDINNIAREQAEAAAAKAAELAIEKTAPKQDTGKSVSDYLNGIQQEKPE